MTREEVFRFVESELRRVAGEAALRVRDPRCPYCAYLRALGSEDAARAARDLDFEEMVQQAAAWRLEVAARLTVWVCRELAQEKRTLMAIRDALEIPR